MNTPTYTLRLPKEVQKDVEVMGRIYGAPTGRAFVRQMLEAMCSRDVSRIHAFVGGIHEGLTGQMRLQLETQARADIRKRAARCNRSQKKGGRRERT